MRLMRPECSSRRRRYRYRTYDGSFRVYPSPVGIPPGTPAFRRLKEDSHTDGRTCESIHVNPPRTVDQNDQNDDAFSR